MILILEGPDGAGKTTFARQFRNAKYHHEGPPLGVPNLADYYLDLVSDARRDGGPHVFDRLAMSEVVYGPILRGMSRIDRHQWAVFKSGAAGLGAITIICLPRFEVCEAAWHAKQKESELIKTPVDLLRVWNHYAALSMNSLRYDWTCGALGTLR